MRVFVLLGLLAGAMALKYGQKERFNTDFVDIVEDDDYFYMASNGLPQHAYEDVNRNSATGQDYNFTIPKTPTDRTPNAGPSCIPGGPVGISLWGRY